MLTALLVVIAVAGVMLTGYFQRQARLEQTQMEAERAALDGSWVESARRMGLMLREHQDETEAVGTVSGFEVTARVGRGAESMSLRLELRSEMLPKAITIRPTAWAESSSAIATQAQKPIADTPRVLTADRFFDGQFSVWGPADLALALLSTRLREILLPIHRFQLSDGVVSVATGEFAETRFPIESLIRQLLAPAQLLIADVQRLDERLYQNIRNDVSPSTRVQNAKLLFARFPESPCCEGALETMLLEIGEPKDPLGIKAAWLELMSRCRPEDPRTMKAHSIALADKSALVRLKAASAGGPEVKEVLFDLATNPDGTGTVRTEALELLVERFGLNELHDLLLRCLTDPAARIREIARKKLIHDGATQLSKCFYSVILTNKDPAVVSDAVRGIGASKEVDAEAWLCRCLPLPSDEARWTAAAELGRIGTVSSVRALREAGANFFNDLYKGTVYQDAIEAIQSRVPGADAGQLSLSAPGAADGALSITDEMGRLALSDPSVLRGQKGEPKR